MVSQRQRARAARSAGWVATLAGALLMVVVGFGIGFVSGAAFEEPGLLFQHLRGGMEPIALESAPEPATTGAAATPAGPVERTAQPAESPPPVAAAPPAAKPHQGAPAAREAGYVIQVGAFASSESARRLVRQLEASGLSSYVREETEGPVRYKVRVGPFPSRGEAEAMAQRLKRDKRLPTWVLSRDEE